METTPWLDPRFLLVAGGQLVLMIFFIAKLWFSANDAHKRLDASEEAHEVSAKDLRIELKEVKVEFYRHLADVKAHHNEEAVQEFRTALERRFTGMEKSLEDIARKLNHLADRE